ncbi:MAG: fumarylacetoacetate hydrolase family protein [Gammaproteobacteria bacterium]|nr:fumarylacetoacetate hydrolase family protein [Gammaproteobacteria bacterium]
MRLATLRIGGAHHIGVVTDAGIVDLALTARSHATTLDAHQLSSMTALLDGGPDALAAAAALARQGTPRAFEPSELGLPIPAPRKLLLLAGNYAEHIMEGGRRLHECDKATPRVFMKPPSTTLGGPRADIPIPPIARFVDWEAELAVVIGRRGKAITAEAARGSHRRLHGPERRF